MAFVRVGAVLNVRMAMPTLFALALNLMFMVPPSPSRLHAVRLQLTCEVCPSGAATLTVDVEHVLDARVSPPVCVTVGAGELAQATKFGSQGEPAVTVQGTPLESFEKFTGSNPWHTFPEQEDAAPR